MARLVAHSLAIGYANAETAECRPGAKALAADCGTSVRTIERALLDLENAGWIERLGGNAPGVLASIRFRFPEQHPPTVADEHPPRLADEHPPTLAATPATIGNPPIPPYKDKPNMNQNAGANRWPRSATKVVVPGGVRPCPTSQLVEIGSESEMAWNEWLAHHGWPMLSEIGRKGCIGRVVGWDMPTRWPPSEGDELATATAGRFVQWLRSKA
jgi:hypothetical protein